MFVCHLHGTTKLQLHCVCVCVIFCITVCNTSCSQEEDDAGVGHGV